ncbi:M20 family metallo-hydrolase [Balneolaceae bacterium YR4-1]|uniref:M20 family metallo-hydrolase n=1 Tax=Halalkalibaculum roseum TaxID=2709311 RepID=A0A6M1SYS3_9BACT|nr:M20 family metallo-hydrolase [Halalkalibaculum roseum]NGP77086.1 M20 family metallo-hydrolase [Halalkalibaculum roseum]
MNIPFGSIINLLTELVSTPSHSGEESETAGLIAAFLEKSGVTVERHLNNVWAQSQFFDDRKPTLLLNSHHDTVKPGEGYSFDPYQPFIEDGKLYGLGSNDAGGALVSLIATFLNLYDKTNLPFNLLFAASAEEEISGENGISSILKKIPDPDCAIVGEPTRLRMATAEKGLMVLDCTSKGISGHAARDEGENAIYMAMNDISWFKNYSFEKSSDLLGPVKMTVTGIDAGSQHNVVPDSCRFMVDVRTTDAYDNRETLSIIQNHVHSKVVPRSLRLNSSSIPESHPLVTAGSRMGLDIYGSPTLSDQALINFPSIKLGPGDSARSHTADEYIALAEIKSGIDTYYELINKLETP